MSLLQIDRAFWGLFGLVWLVGAAFSRRTVHREALGSRLRYGVPLAIGVALIFSHLLAPELPWLEFRLVPNDDPFLLAGVVLTALGVGFAIWARVELGRLWSGAITLKEGHHLVTTGPYAFARHPIYTGAIVGLVGTTIAMGIVRSAIGLVVAVASLIAKLGMEENLLATQFGAEHEAYRKRVKKLVPFVW